MHDIRFSVSAPAANSGHELTKAARRAERLGYRALRAPDHPGAIASPFVVLSHAAAVTTELRLETYVLNAGLRDPLPLACDVATLDRLSDGRVTLGLGAGHSPTEWQMQSLTRPSVRERIDRMIEVATCTRQLLAGASVSVVGSHVELDQAQLLTPRPVQDPIPLLIGGSNPRVIDFALDHADVIGLTGLGRTLADGHLHETRWSESELDALARQLAHRPDGCIVEALVQFVKITDDRETDAARFADRWTTSSAHDVLGSPFVLMGTAEQIADELLAHHERFGITSYSIRADAMEVMAQFVSN